MIWPFISAILFQPFQAPLSSVNLEGATFHVQGLLVRESSVFVTSVDRAGRKGYLFEFDHSGRRIRTLEIHQGELIHPGGFDGDDTALWIPVAEYRPDGRSVIQRRDRQTLQVTSGFEVADHIGALAVSGGRLIMANWDARRVYEYDFEGKLLRERRNPTAYRIQDWKFRSGALVAAALAPRGSGSPAVVWIDPETLEPLSVMPAENTDRGVPYTNEGLDIYNGRLWLLPEDSPSRLFVFDPLRFSRD